MIQMNKFSSYLWSVSCLLCISMVSCDFGIMSVSKRYNDSEGHKFCLAYNPYFNDLPDNQGLAAVYKMADLMPSYGCKAPLSPSKLDDKVVFVNRGNCTFSEKALLVYSSNGTAMIVVNAEGLSFSPGANNISDYTNINMTVAMISQDDYEKLKALGPGMNLQMFKPEESRIDYNLILIWTMAVMTIFIGAFWSGVNKHNQYLRRKLAHGMPSRDDVSHRETPDEEETLDISPPFVFIFVLMMVGMLVALYFFYDYLVYAVIGLFCLASCVALHGCLKPLIVKIPICTRQLPPNRIPILSTRPEIRSIVLFFLCAGVVVWWGIERKAGYAWILQDVLGIVFCVHMMKTIRLPSLKACAILLLLLFVYDIFFVFVTPLITKGHQSIMVQVATGQGSSTGEQLPMVLKVPRFIQTTLSICHVPYSLLGFGDILVPGLLVSYVHGFDLKVQSKCRVYFVSTLIAYGLGLLATFCALILMEKGQPALLYLVPFTLLTVFSIGWYRKEFRLLWNGEKVRRSEDTESHFEDDASSIHTRAPPTVIITTNGNTANINNRRPSPNGNGSGSDGEPENVRLLSDSR